MASGKTDRKSKDRYDATNSVRTGSRSKNSGHGSKPAGNAEYSGQGGNQRPAAPPPPCQPAREPSSTPSPPMSTQPAGAQASAPVNQQSNSSPLLGGTKKDGPVQQNVRSSWSARFPESTGSVHDSSPNENVQSAPVLDTVRSVWSSRFPQSKGPTDSLQSGPRAESQHLN